MKTNYEIRVEKGELPPLEGLDIVVIDTIVCDIIKAGKFADDKEKQLILDIWDEIAFIYKDDKDTLDAIKEITEN